MVFHTFSALFSRCSFLLFPPPLTRLHHWSENQPHDLGFPLLTLFFSTPWPVHTPVQSTLDPQRHTYRTVKVSIPRPTSHPLLQRPLSSLNAFSIPPNFFLCLPPPMSTHLQLCTYSSATRPWNPGLPAILLPLPVPL